MIKPFFKNSLLHLEVIFVKSFIADVRLISKYASDKSTKYAKSVSP